MKKIIKAACILLLCALVLTSCFKRNDVAANKAEKTKHLFLIAGMDDAAANTDVLFTLSYDADTLTTRIAQIPRDTYFNFGNSQNKINQVYASELSAGKSRHEALDSFARMLEGAFGVKFDGFIGVNLSVLRKLVDSLGGVDIVLNSDMEISVDGIDGAISLKKGVNKIDGETAEKFVRFRSGYAMGDLGRVDAQKIFLNALFTKVAEGVSLPLLLNIVRIVQNETVTDLSFTKFVNLVFDSISKKGEKTTLYATVPGEPTNSPSGLSYYVLNKKSTEEMVKKYMFSYSVFDPEKRFVSEEYDSFYNIYYDESVSVREFTRESLSDMHIARSP